MVRQGSATSALRSCSGLQLLVLVEAPGGPAATGAYPDWYPKCDGRSAERLSTLLHGATRDSRA